MRNKDAAEDHVSCCDPKSFIKFVRKRHLLLLFAIGVTRIIVRLCFEVKLPGAGTQVVFSIGENWCQREKCQSEISLLGHIVLLLASTFDDDFWLRFSDSDYIRECARRVILNIYNIC